MHHRHVLASRRRIRAVSGFLGLSLGSAGDNSRGFATGGVAGTPWVRRVVLLVLSSSMALASLATGVVIVALVPATAGASPDPVTAYVVNDLSNSVTPILVGTNTPGTPIPVGDQPVKVAITPNGKTAYVTNRASNTVTPIVLATNTPGTPIPVGNRPIGVAITPDGHTAYVANFFDNTVTPIAVATNTPGTPIPAGNHPGMIAITPDGATAYVTNSDDSTVTPIAVATNTPGSPIPAGANPAGIAITPDGHTAYITNRVSSGTVTPVTVATNTPGTPIPAGAFPTGIAITPDGKTAYVTSDISSVTPIAVSTNTAGPPIPVGSKPDGLAITPDGTTAYVTNTDDGTVTPIAVATNTPGSPILVGAGPLGIAITPVTPAMPTSTQLSTHPSSPVAAGTTETLTATITPSTAAGKVQFSDGSTPLGSPQTVAAGHASLTTTLPIGTHSLTAVFIPTDTAAFTGSVSSTVSLVVYATATTTRLIVAPNPAFSVIPVILVAHVTPHSAARGAAGTIQFADGAIPLGNPVSVNPGGIAILTTTALATGTHALTATFTPADPIALGPSTSPPIPLTVRSLF